MPGNVTLSTAAVPEGTCPTWIIERWPELVALLSANLNGTLNTFNDGSSTPAPADQGKPWDRTNSDGTPDKWYRYSGGLWISPHPLLAGARIIAPATLVTPAQIWAWDGGDGSDPAATVPVGAVGAMWEVDPDLMAKFPLGAGTGPAPDLTNFAVNATGGEEKHSLLLSEMPPHTHDVRVIQADTDGGTSVQRLRPMTNAESGPFQVQTESTGGTGSPLAVVAHNTMPLYRVVYFLRKTARKYYTP